MNSTKIDLQSEERRIELEIEQLRLDLVAVRRLIQRHSIHQQLEIGGVNSIIGPKLIGLTVAITRLFEDFPDKEWSPSELRDYLLPAYFLLGY